MYRISRLDSRLRAQLSPPKLQYCLLFTGGTYICLEDSVLVVCGRHANAHWFFIASGRAGCERSQGLAVARQLRQRPEAYSISRGPLPSPPNVAAESIHANTVDRKEGLNGDMNLAFTREHSAAAEGV